MGDGLVGLDGGRRASNALGRPGPYRVAMWIARRGASGSKVLVAIRLDVRGTFGINLTIRVGTGGVAPRRFL